MAKEPKDMRASVRQRLLNLSREQGRVFDVVLVTYGLERVIYRLSISKYRDQFVLKGGMLVTLWTIDDNRVTRDADFLGYGKADENTLKSIFSDILSIKQDDGLLFDIEALTVAPIREDQEYGGMRLKTTAYLGNTRIPITVDIGFGDAISNAAYTIDYPSLLDMPTANIRAYPPAAVVAEKFQAIVVFGLANGRMKDYYDLWAIPNAMTIEPAELDAAIRATFDRRGTQIPENVPAGLSQSFSREEEKTRQWQAYVGSIDLRRLALEDVVETIWSYVGPACERLTRK